MNKTSLIVSFSFCLLTGNGYFFSTLSNYFQLLFLICHQQGLVKDASHKLLKYYIMSNLGVLNKWWWWGGNNLEPIMSVKTKKTKKKLKIMHVYVLMWKRMKIFNNICIILGMHLLSRTILGRAALSKKVNHWFNLYMIVNGKVLRVTGTINFCDKEWRI